MDLADIGTDALILELERRDAVGLVGGGFLVEGGAVDWDERARLRLFEDYFSELGSLVRVERISCGGDFSRVSATMRVVR